MPDEPYRRRSARILLLDGADRILLFQAYLSYVDPASGHGWWTPGGGVSDGEPLNDAAARELREETGLIVVPEDLGPVVAETSGYADLGFAKGIFRDDYFFYRINRHDVDISEMEDHERSRTIGYRWWTLDELASTTEIVFPFRLRLLLDDLLAGRIPREPVRLPWHH